MTRDVNEAFASLLSWLTPSGTESAKAASHRLSIKACLEANFGMTNFFRAGSFGHGTSIRGYSDVDYFAVIPTDRLKRNSSLTLRQVKEALAARFTFTPVYVDSPAVAVQFGSEGWERHEITPVDLLFHTGRYNVYDMPNRYGDWMKSSPLGLNAYVNAENDRLNKKAKPLIRLIKLWNYNAGVGLRSIYIELRVAEYLRGESAVVYPVDVLRALRHLKTKNLARMRDPLGLGADIFPCSGAERPTAYSKLSTAVARAEKAYHAPDPREAFAWWTKVFGGDFPAYD